MTGFYDDDSKITYPDAERLVVEYLRERPAEKAQATSKTILDWHGVRDTHHNRIRIHDGLDRLCERTRVDWAGRTVFRLPNPGENQ